MCTQFKHVSKKSPESKLELAMALFPLCAAVIIMTLHHKTGVFFMHAVSVGGWQRSSQTSGLKQCDVVNSCEQGDVFDYCAFSGVF